MMFKKKKIEESNQDKIFELDGYRIKRKLDIFSDKFVYGIYNERDEYISCGHSIKETVDRIHEIIKNEKKSWLTEDEVMKELI